MSVPSINIWNGVKNAQPIIAMNPIFFRTEVVKDDSALWHERTHSVLRAT